MGYCNKHSMAHRASLCPACVGERHERAKDRRVWVDRRNRLCIGNSDSYYAYPMTLEALTALRDEIHAVLREEP